MSGTLYIINCAHALHVEKVLGKKIARKTCWSLLSYQGDTNMPSTKLAPNYFPESVPFTEERERALLSKLD